MQKACSTSTAPRFPFIYRCRRLRSSSEQFIDGCIFSRQE
ncbi:unnamed protein product [Brassica oleracea var. botrytis]